MNELLSSMIAKATTGIQGLLPAVEPNNMPEWKRNSRDNQPIKRPAPDKNSEHPGAIQGKKINTTRRMVKAKANRNPSVTSSKRWENERAVRKIQYKHRDGAFAPILSNHDRVSLGRESRK